MSEHCVEADHAGGIRLSDEACCPCQDVIIKVDWTVSGIIMPDWENRDVAPLPGGCTPNPAFCTDEVCCDQGFSMQFSARTKHEFKLFSNPSAFPECGILPSADVCSGGDLVGLSMNPADLISSSAVLIPGTRTEDDDLPAGCDLSGCPACPSSPIPFNFLFLFIGGRTDIGFRIVRANGSFWFIPYGLGTIENTPALASLYCRPPAAGHTWFGWGCPTGVNNLPIQAFNLGNNPPFGNFVISFNYTLDQFTDLGFGVFPGHSGSIIYSLNFT